MAVCFADPKIDLPFKKLFGTQEHKGLLIELLNALLQLTEATRIVDIQYLSPEQLPTHDGLKLSILDVKCTDAQGARYIVEMQVFPVEGFEKRVVLNACKAYVEQLESGQGYGKLSDVIAVTICNFALWPASVKMLSRWRMREDESHESGLTQIQYVFLELAKYTKGDHPESLVDKWAYFFREAHRLTEVPKEFTQAPFVEAFETVRRVNFNAEEWTEYERAQMAVEDYYGGFEYAHKHGLQQGIEKGRQEGEKRGLEKGKEQGLKEGLEKGKLEGVRSTLFLLFSARGLSVSTEERAHIEAQNDIYVLSRWLTQAATASTVLEALREEHDSSRA